MPGARGTGQHRARPTQVGHFRAAATLDEGPEYVDNLEVIIAEFDSALEQGHQALVWGSDAQAKKLQEQIAGGKQVKLIKVRRSAARMLTPQPQLHAADAPWRLTLVRSGEPPALEVMDWENWSLQSAQQRGRDLPTRMLGDNLTVFVFAGDVENEVQGPGANQQRDAEEERRRRWNLVPRELKRSIERVHSNLGHPPLPALLRACASATRPWRPSWRRGCTSVKRLAKYCARGYRSRVSCREWMSSTF